MKKLGVIEFPGTHSVENLVESLKARFNVEVLLPTVERLRGYDVLLIPGGFSYGDYLRPGAVASVQPICRALRAYAKEGGKVLGFGNGFQVLCECEILPGLLLQNPDGNFVWGNFNFTVSDKLGGGDYSLPIANYYGSYTADDRTMKSIDELVAFRFVESGKIAGLMRGNVLGTICRFDRLIANGNAPEMIFKFLEA